MKNAIWPGTHTRDPLPEPNDEEACLALLPDEWFVSEEGSNSIMVKRLQNSEEFKLWATINNGIMHPDNHFHLSERGVMPCFIAYYDGIPAAVCSIMNNNDISSIEFVAALEEFRRKGLAKAVCIAAITDAVNGGSKIISTRGFGASKQLFKSLGFKVY